MPPGAKRDNSQPARRAHTIIRLLDATIDSLVEDGYAPTTIRAVARRAGMSQGAATHHFAKRLDLVAAAIERLSEQRLAELHAAVSALPDEAGARRKGALDLLCGASAGPLFVAWARLWVASAEDDALRERLRPLERRAGQLIAALAVPEVAAAPAFDARLAIALSILSGLGLQLRFDPRGMERRCDPWPVHRAGIELILTAPAAAPGMTTDRSEARC
jgi:AcrR family transcriptional regulator